MAVLIGLVTPGLMESSPSYVSCALFYADVFVLIKGMLI